MKKIVMLGFVFVGMLAGCTSSREPSGTETPQSSDSIEVLEPSSGESAFSVEGTNYSVSIPEEWAELADPTELNPDASFALEKSDFNSYYMVIAENKVDFADLDTYVELVTGNLEGQATNLSEEAITINGMTGIRKNFDLQIQGMNLVYIFDIVESDTQFVQSIGWSLKSVEEEARTDLETILNSLTQE